MKGHNGESPSQKEVEVNKYIFLYLIILKGFQVGVAQSGVNAVEGPIKSQSLN